MFRLKSTKNLILAILDFVIIAIVIYGLTDWVYEGYPSWVPYAIIIFFFVMASIRFYKFSATLKESNSVDSRNIESLFAEDESEEGSDNSVSASGFHKRRSKLFANKNAASDANNDK